jgi:hypothetical protein
MMKKTLAVTLALAISAASASAILAAEKSVSGTLEDSFCFVTMGAHGAGHKKCATECARKGIPVALVEKGTDNMYVLLPAKNDAALPEEVLSKMEEDVTVTGDSYNKGGVNYLTVKSVK